MLLHKKFSSAIICLLFVLLMVNQIQAQEVSLKPYGIQSGIIEYKYSGTQLGTSTLYFDEYGYRSAMKMDTKRNNEPQKGWVISFKEYQYIFDPAQPDKGLKMKDIHKALPGDFGLVYSTIVDDIDGDGHREWIAYNRYKIWIFKEV